MAVCQSGCKWNERFACRVFIVSFYAIHQTQPTTNTIRTVLKTTCRRTIISIMHLLYISLHILLFVYVCNYVTLRCFAGRCIFLVFGDRLGVFFPGITRFQLVVLCLEAHHSQPCINHTTDEHIPRRGVSIKVSIAV
jgi:hypothetical protein